MSNRGHRSHRLPSGSSTQSTSSWTEPVGICVRSGPCPRVTMYNCMDTGGSTKALGEDSQPLGCGVWEYVCGLAPEGDTEQCWGGTWGGQSQGCLAVSWGLCTTQKQSPRDARC